MDNLNSNRKSRGKDKNPARERLTLGGKKTGAQSDEAVLEEFLQDIAPAAGYTFADMDIRNGQVYYIQNRVPAGRGIPFLRNGLYFGELRKGRFEPSQSLAMALRASDYASVLDFPQADERVRRYLLPEYGTSSLSRRLTLLFVQLLDISKRQNYRMTWNSHYALSLLLMELSSEVLITQQIEKNDIPMQMLTIIEWIRIHYEQPLTVAGIAERFNYHPTYLTGLFKKYTGYPLMTYINRVRITISKNLLTDQAYKVSTVARLCGFTDEKYFMKLFKRYEGMTPSQYRNTFHQKKMNLI